MIDLFGGLSNEQLARMTYMQNPTLDPAPYLGRLDSAGEVTNPWGAGLKVPQAGNPADQVGLQAPPLVMQDGELQMSTGLGVGDPRTSATAGMAPEGLGPLLAGMQMLGSAQQQGPTAPDPGGVPGGGKPFTPQPFFGAAQPVGQMPGIGQLLARLK